MGSRTENQKGGEHQAKASEGHPRTGDKKNFRDSREGNFNRGGHKDNSYKNRNNHGHHNGSNNSVPHNSNPAVGGHNDSPRYQSRIPTRVKVEETIEDIKADVARIEKEIQLMISEIKNMRF